MSKKHLQWTINISKPKKVNLKWFKNRVIIKETHIYINKAVNFILILLLLEVNHYNWNFIF